VTCLCVYRVIQRSFRTRALRAFLTRWRAVCERQWRWYSASVAEHNRSYVRPVEMHSAWRHEQLSRCQQWWRQCGHQSRSLGNYFQLSTGSLCCLLWMLKITHLRRNCFTFFLFILITFCKENARFAYCGVLTVITLFHIVGFACGQLSASTLLFALTILNLYCITGFTIQFWFCSIWHLISSVIHLLVFSCCLCSSLHLMMTYRVLNQMLT